MPLRILLLNWRDMGHPEAGGAEKYLVTVAEGLAARGHHVTFRTAWYPGAPRHEVVRGVHYVREGGRLDIYPRSLMAQLVRRHRADVVVDVQNGVPYLSPLVRRGPVINLVHHVHKEQWPVLFGPRLTAAGWWLESRLAPRVYRRSPYVAVSSSTRHELVGLGIDEDRITIIHNGTDALPFAEAARSTRPSLVVLGRLVPQKRVEMALEVVHALQAELPDLTLDIVGSGACLHDLEEHARRLGVQDRVTFHGHVSEQEKHELLARAWVHVMPSLKEGWGLVVVEAGVHGTPTVAFAEAGGPRDSIVDGQTGLLIEGGEDALTSAVRRLLVDDVLRERLSAEASRWVRQFHWDETVARWEQLLESQARRRR